MDKHRKFLNSFLNLIYVFFSFRVQAQERQDDMGRMVLLVESQNHYRVQNKSQKAELQQHQVLLERIHTEKAILVTQLSTLQGNISIS